MDGRDRQQHRQAASLVGSHQGYDSDEGLGAMTKVSMMGPGTSPNNCSARNRQRQPLGPMAAPAASQQELQVR